MDKLQQENLELVRKLAAQEEALGYSNRQLDQRSSECQALSRQLEAALSDVRQQVKIREEKLESKWCHQQTTMTKHLLLYFGRLLSSSRLLNVKSTKR